MLAIRLARFGAKKQAAYRVVVMEKSRARNSRSVEVVGHYNPRQKPSLIELSQERVEYWLSHGAQPSDRVSRLLKVYKERPAQTAEEQAAAKKPAGKAAQDKPAAASAAGNTPAAEASAVSGEEPKTPA
jgi:small subunit ribosomal protein S16